MSIEYRIDINVATNFLAEQSEPQQNRFVFAYTITIRNTGQVAARLLNRNWTITHANGKVETVHGEGVVGERPHLAPGESFRYTSGAILESAVGTMQGNYEMLADDGHQFVAEVPSFILSIPRTIH